MSALTTVVENGIAVVTFDLPGEPVNKLSDAVKVEFEALLIRLRDESLIGDEVFRRIQQELDLEESRLVGAGSAAPA